MGDNAVWKFHRQGGLKHGSYPWYGKDIFLNHQIGIELLTCIPTSTTGSGLG